ncbi:unnamed protein product [Lymnaea stagnalis]|uniref:Uncharacterized protein n=1 Tax=Lymnaea stagnalis TaxID=6523 RepID=A0AAV2H989_LYMST
MTMNSGSKLPFYEVVVKEEAPFVVLGKDSEGNRTFSGLSIDLLQLVAEKAQFQYNIKLTDHSSYGYQDHVGKWNGLISEISNKNADIAVGPIPPKPDSYDMIEFTKPYLSSGISLLIKYPSEGTRGIGLMLDPFTTEVWTMICLAFIVISLALFLIGRFSPYEWARVSKDKDVRLARTSFGLKNSFLFAASTLSWQGYREAPRSISGRILMCMWFMFTVFVMVAYTACLCAILTTRGESARQHLSFSSFEDIADSKVVKLGAMKYNHVHWSLKLGKSSHNNLFAKLYSYIDDSQEWIQKRQEGIQRVKDSGGKYALLLETIKADYVTATNCDLITYGEKLASFGYTFAVPKGSPLLERINLAILEQVEDGAIQKLMDKHIFRHQVCPQYDKTKLIPQKGGTTQKVTSSMDMRDMAIPFLFLFLGVLGAGGALGAEIYYRRRLAMKNSDDKARKPLNTEAAISKAPKSSPPPPPIYKVTNKLQDSGEKEKQKSSIVVVTETPTTESSRDVESAEACGENFEMVPLDDKVELDKQEDNPKQEVKYDTEAAVIEAVDKSLDKDKAEVINETA